MASKDKGRGDKASNKKAVKSLKEKRAAKKMKKAADGRGGNRSVDRTFGN